MPANSHLSVVNNMAVSRVVGQTTITIDDTISREVDSWVTTTNNATDDRVAITSNVAEDGVTTINNAVGVGVTATNNAMEDQSISTNDNADDMAVITVDSVEDGVTAIRDIPEDDHKDEFLATASSCHPKDSHNDAEGEEEVEDEILESVSTVLLKIKNNFNSLNSFSFSRARKLSSLL